MPDPGLPSRAFLLKLRSCPQRKRFADLKIVLKEKAPQREGGPWGLSLCRGAELDELGFQIDSVKINNLELNK